MRTVILTPSGMRGKVNIDMTLENVLHFTQSFAIWLGKGSKVALGRDTRNSSPLLSNIVSAGLTSMGIHVIDTEILPTPIIMHYIRNKNLSGGVIITGSHNPEEYNGIKYVGHSHTFIDNSGIEQIQQIHDNDKIHQNLVNWNEFGKITTIDAKKIYLKRLVQFIDKKPIKKKSLKVFIDSNAGAASGVIDVLLASFGCKISTINAKFHSYPKFPRKIEPIAENLAAIRKKIQQQNGDIGFAYDCDADRVTVIGPDGSVYREDMSVLLPLYYTLEQNQSQSTPKQVLIVTNIASSLAFDDIAQQFQGSIIRTPIGEQYLARKIAEMQKKYPNTLVLGGEGSSGGFMYPDFNNARDGIFAACKICEILSLHDNSLPDLIKNIPLYPTCRESFHIDHAIEKIQNLCELLDTLKITYEKIGNDVKIFNSVDREWILIHPSNTESVVRIIAEATEKKRASDLIKKYCAYLQK